MERQHDELHGLLRSVAKLAPAWTETASAADPDRLAEATSFDVAADPATGEVHALRGPAFAGSPVAAVGS